MKKDENSYSILILSVHPRCEWLLSEMEEKLLSPFCNWLRWENVPFAYHIELNRHGRVFFYICVSRSVSCIHVRRKWNMLQSQNALVIAENDYLGPISTDVQVFGRDRQGLSDWVKSQQWPGVANWVTEI